MFKKILVATDGSEHSEKAAKIGVELARLYGGEVAAVYVADTTRMSRLPDDMLIFSIRELLVKEGKEALGFVEGLAKDAGIGFSKEILEGNPGEEILGYVKREGVDMVVMGSIGRSGLDKFLLGSVAEKVIRNSSVPVLTIPGGRA